MPYGRGAGNLEDMKKALLAPAAAICLAPIIYYVHYSERDLWLERAWRSLEWALSESSQWDLSALAGHCLSAGLALAIVFAGWGVGKSCLILAGRMNLLHDVGRVGEGEGPAAATVIAIGFGVIGLVVSLAGFAGLFRKWPLAAILVLSLVAAVYRLYTDRDGAMKKVKRSITLGSAAVFLPLFLVCLYCILPGVVNAFSPPTELDELIYHLALPAAYLRRGQIHELPYNAMSYNTLGAHMLYSLAMAMGSDVSAKLLHLFACVLCAAQVYRLAERIGGKTSAWLAAAIFFGHPLVGFIAGVAYIDFFPALFFLGAVDVYLDWRKDASRRLSPVFFFLLGLCFSAKMTALYLAAPLTIIASADVWRARPQKFPSDLALGGAFLFAAVCPWIVRSLVWTGDPLYPFITAELFPNSPEAYVLGVSLEGSYKLVGMGRNFHDYLLAPWNLFVHGKQFHPHFYGALHPGLAALLIAGIPAMLRSPEGRRLGLCLLAGAWLWSLGHQFMRYFSPGFALATALGPAFVLGGKADEKGPRAFSIKAALVSIMVVPCLLAPVSVLPKFSDSLLYFSGTLKRDAYLDKRLPFYKMDGFISKELPRDAVILNWFEAKIYYTQRDSIIHHPEIYDMTLYDVARAKDQAELTQWFKSRGITHALVHRPNLGYYARMLGKESAALKDLDEATEKIDHFLAAKGEKIHWSAGLELYKINYRRSDGWNAKP